VLREGIGWRSPAPSWGACCPRCSWQEQLQRPIACQQGPGAGPVERGAAGQNRSCCYQALGGGGGGGGGGGQQRRQQALTRAPACSSFLAPSRSARATARCSCGARPAGAGRGCWHQISTRRGCRRPGGWWDVTNDRLLHRAPGIVWD
jgi:hypothetical protein